MANFIISSPKKMCAFVVKRKVVNSCHVYKFLRYCYWFCGFFAVIVCTFKFCYWHLTRDYSLTCLFSALPFYQDLVFKIHDKSYFPCVISSWIKLNKTIDENLWYLYRNKSTYMYTIYIWPENFLYSAVTKKKNC